MDWAKYTNYLWGNPNRVCPTERREGALMKIYLLNPPYFPHFFRSARWQDTGRGGTLYYPIWLAYAAALLEKYHPIRLVDAPAWNWDRKSVIEDVQQYDPELIVIDSSFTSLKNDLEVAGEIKTVCRKPIVLVGPPTARFYQSILETSEVDVVARFEYEYTLVDIARAVEDGKGFAGVEGIAYKQDGQIIQTSQREWSGTEGLDAIPFVSQVYKRHLNINDYFLSSSLYPEVQIFTGRGCPHLCTFCAWPETLMGRKYRVRSMSNVLDELEYIENNIPRMREVFFEDDTFTISKQRVREFCRGYDDRKLKIAWACNARATLDYETLDIMKRSGCRLVIVGYESGDDEILKKIKKGVNTDNIRRFAKDARRAGPLTMEIL